MKFTDIRTKAGELTRTAADRARVTARAAKLNMDISAQQEIIKRACCELGRLYYHDSRTEIAPEGAEYRLWVNRIDEAEKKTAQLRAQLAELKGIPTDTPAQTDAPTGQIDDFEIVVLDNEDGD